MTDITRAGWTDELQKRYEEYLAIYGTVAVMLDPSGSITVLPPNEIDATIAEIMNDNEADK